MQSLHWQIFIRSGLSLVSRSNKNSPSLFVMSQTLWEREWPLTLRYAVGLFLAHKQVLFTDTCTNHICMLCATYASKANYFYDQDRTTCFAFFCQSALGRCDFPLSPSFTDFYLSNTNSSYSNQQRCTMTRHHMISLTNASVAFHSGWKWSRMFWNRCKTGLLVNHNTQESPRWPFVVHYSIAEWIMSFSSSDQLYSEKLTCLIQIRPSKALSIFFQWFCILIVFSSLKLLIPLWKNTC